MNKENETSNNSKPMAYDTLLAADEFQPNGKYNFPIGLEFYEHKNMMDEKSQKVKCKITGHIWISPEVGGVYNCLAESEVENMDCNWNATYSKNTSTCELSLFKAFKRGDFVCS